MTKGIKTVLKVAGIVVGAGVVLYILANAFVLFDLFAVSPIAGDKAAKNYLKEIKGIELPRNTEIVKEYAEYTYYGTDCEQPFAGIIVRSDLSLEELDEYYAPYRASEEVREKKELSDKTVTNEVKETLKTHGLEIPIDMDFEDGGYYLIYTTCYNY